MPRGCPSWAARVSSTARAGHGVGRAIRPLENGEKGIADELVDIAAMAPNGLDLNRQESVEEGDHPFQRLALREAREIAHIREIEGRVDHP
jgi:hypothetical protein